MERLSKKLLMKIVACMSEVSKIIEAALTKFHLCECGVGAAPYEIWT